MTNLIVDFRNFTKAPKNVSLIMCNPSVVCKLPLRKYKSYCNDLQRLSMSTDRELCVV